MSRYDLETILDEVPTTAREDYKAVVIDAETPASRAAERGVRPSTVNQNVNRAIKQIRKEFEGDPLDPLNNVHVEEAIGLYLEPRKWNLILHTLNAAADIRLEYGGEIDAKRLRNLIRLLSEQLNNRVEEAASREST